MNCKLIGYRRVSTVRQGDSRLGLEAQDEAIRRYASITGCDLVRSYTEVETGRRDEMENRPELLNAIAHANRAKATLVIAKLDRLSRSVYVTATLHKTGVDFVCCDNPTANRLTIQILAAVAENEGDAIGLRVKEALKAYKDGKRVSKSVTLFHHGNVPQDVIDATAGKLGASLPQCRNLTDEGRRKGAQSAGATHRRKADTAYFDLVPVVTRMRQEGSTLQGIADHLNAEGHRTRNEKLWSHVQVMRVLDRSSNIE